MTRGITVDTGCNLACEYCYEHPSREVKSPEYDIEAIINALETWKDKWPNETPPGLHGGEPMLIPDDDMERFFKFINENWDGHPWMQTNGSLIEEHHIDMFKEYNVHVGVSCDGPGELNKKRISKDGKTDERTQQTIQNIHRLVDNGVSVGMIIVVHRHNTGTNERLDRLLSWMDELTKKGVSGHFNPGRVPTSELELSAERYGEVLIRSWEWVTEEPYRNWDPMMGLQDAVIKNSVGKCSLGKCDPRGTESAKSITGDGEFSGCARMWPQLGDGNPIMEGPSNNDSYGSFDGRYEMLKQTPQDAGGCAGCEYWNICHGGCPGNAIGSDYRRKTHWCESFKMFYDHVKDQMRSIFPNLEFKQENDTSQPFTEVRNRVQDNVSYTPSDENEKSESEKVYDGWVVGGE